MRSPGPTVWTQHNTTREGLSVCWLLQGLVMIFYCTGRMNANLVDKVVRTVHEAATASANGEFDGDDSAFEADGIKRTGSTGSMCRPTLNRTSSDPGLSGHDMVGGGEEPAASVLKKVALGKRAPYGVVRCGVEEVTRVSGVCAARLQPGVCGGTAAHGGQDEAGVALLPRDEGRGFPPGQLRTFEIVDGSTCEIERATVIKHNNHTLLLLRIRR